MDFDHSINATIKPCAVTWGIPPIIPGLETLARRGYRLMLTIEKPEPTARAALEKEKRARTRGDERQIKPSWWKAAVVVGSTVILVGSTYIARRHFRASTLPKAERITPAVLPSQNLSGDLNKEYLPDGLTEGTISQLGGLNPEQLGGIARTSVMGYKHEDERGRTVSPKRLTNPS